MVHKPIQGVQRKMKTPACYYVDGNVNFRRVRIQEDQVEKDKIIIKDGVKLKSYVYS